MRRLLVLVLVTAIVLVLVIAIGAVTGFACGSAPPHDGTHSAPEAPAAPATAAPVPLALGATGIEVSWMDPAADPCADFFAYACGGFVATTEIPADRSSYGATELVQRQNEDTLHEILEKAAASPGDDPGLRKIGDYYASCMDEEAVEKAGLSPLAPLLGPIAKVKDFASLARALTFLHARTVFPLFRLTSTQDFNDATLVVGSLDQSRLSLPDRDYYLKDEGNLKEMRTFFVGHVGRVLALLGTPAREVVAAADDVVRIETEIARLQQDKVTRRDPYKVYHRVEHDGLARLAPRFPWTAYWKAVGTPDTPELTVNDPAYYTGIEALLRKEPPAAWRRYLAYQVVRRYAPVLPRAFVDETFALRQKLTGQKELEPRWKRCVRSTDNELGELLGQAYVKARFAGDAKERARAVTEGIREAMRADLAEVAWMDAPTREAAVAKIGEMNVKVGYPDNWRHYDFEVSRQAFAKNSMAGDQFEQQRQLAKIGKPVDKNEWGVTPPTVNAYYEPSLNEIVLPAGSLQPPFFGKDFYTPVNLGDIGANWIGHEMTHGFDDQGSQFDAKGNLRDWWSKATKQKFQDDTKCVQEQYGQYEAVPGVKLNGALSSGENIADIGGVKLGTYALAAWQRAHPEERRQVGGFTDEKLYFLAYAQGWCDKATPESLQVLAHSDPHAPPRWRVIGPMIDNPTFAKAYQCAAGTPMNPGKICSVW